MPRKTQFETIRSRHFTWTLRRRGSVYTADGRRNRPPLGRHSLGTRDHDEALARLSELDLAKAIGLGLAEFPANTQPKRSLELQRGIELYMQYLARPAVAGGACAKSRQRYKAVLDKFVTFARQRGVTGWEQLDRPLLTSYLTHLQKLDYADRSIYLEGTLLKQVLKWAIAEGYLPAGTPLVFPLRKVPGTTTHCWKPEEVVAMLEHCRQVPGLTWLADVIAVLSHTGLRISEAATLRWTDVDFAHGRISVTNDRSPKRAATDRRHTKNRRDRWFPIHARLRPVLERLPRTPDGRVLHGPRGGTLKPDTVRNILVTDVIAPLKARFPSHDGELGFEHGRLHSFRHFFCSRCANDGVPERILMNWLGHNDSAMIRIYYHLQDQDAQRRMQQIEFTGPVGGSVVADGGPIVSEAPHNRQAATS